MIDWIAENSLMLLLTVGTGFTFWYLWRWRRELKIGLLGVTMLAVLHTLVGLGCVKAFAVLETLDLSKAGATSLFGAIFFLPLVYWAGAKVTKRDVATTFDVFTPCMVFTLLCARINCILSGCCLGRYVPWGSGARWPTRELEVLFYIIVMIWFWRTEHKENRRGLNYPQYMVAYGAFRFFVEGFRQSDSLSLMHISHLWAAITFCLGLSIYSELKKKNERKNRRRKQNA